MLRAIWPWVALVPALFAGVAALGSAAMALAVRRPAGGISPEARIESSTYGIFAVVALLVAALLLLLAFGAVVGHEILVHAQPPRGGEFD